MTAGSVLCSGHEPPMFHEFPDAVDEPSATAVWLPTARFPVSRAVEPPSKSKPVLTFWYAVQRSTTMLPVLPLSVNPCAELPHAITLLRLCPAAGPVPSLPPSLKPLDRKST